MSVHVFKGTAEQAQELLEEAAYCQHAGFLRDKCGKPTPCEKHPERRSSPRIPHVYTPEENAAFEERIKAVMADPFYRLED